MRHYRKTDDSGMGCIIALVLIIFAMPVVGIYMIVKGDEGQKGLGIVLTIIGVIIWIYLGIQS